MARFVPADVPCFVSTKRLDRLERALQRTHAWKLLPLVSSTPGQDGDPLALRRAITSLLRARSPSIVRGLIRSEVSLALNSWDKLMDAVWLLRLEDPRTAMAWFPLVRRVAYTRIGEAEYFKTKDGASVCMREGIVAFASEAGPGSLFARTLALMSGRSGRSLAQSGAFRTQSAYMPRDHLAFAFITPGRDDSQEPPKTSDSFWSNARHITIGLFEEGASRLDIAVRAELITKKPREMISAQAMQRFTQLPSTTLFATVTTVDFKKALAMADSAGSESTLGRYLHLLSSMNNPDQSGDSENDSRQSWAVGPHAIVAWDQDLRDGATSTPQAALLLECPDAHATRRQLDALASRLIQLIRAVEPASIEEQLGVAQRGHLGATISSIPLRAYASASSLPFMKVLTNTEPAWTVAGGWLIVALSPEHIERILGAHIGLLPTLNGLPNAQFLPRGSPNRSMVSIAQADLATQHINAWLASAAAGAPSLIDPTFWARPERSDRPPRLGIGMAVAQEPGIVTVARVYPETAAHGRLQVGDRILGIEGKLLSLDHPNADLRSAWLTAKGDPGPVVRVSRDGTTLDVQLPKQRPGDDSVISTLRKSPADALRELTAITENIQSATLALSAGDGSHFSARLSLEFSPTPDARRAKRN